VAVNTEESIEHPHVAIRSGEHFFIGTDNGIFSMILGDAIDEAAEIDIPQDTDFFTFSTRDRFVKAAVQISKGVPVAELGEMRSNITNKLLFEPVKSQDQIRGMVIHIDTYENAITNISYKLFKELRKQRPFEVYFAGYRLRKIQTGYMDVGVADLLAIFGTHNMLEIALNQGAAASLCGLSRNTPVTITFFNPNSDRGKT
jgi:S-adenosylmethionine hydrolase